MKEKNSKESGLAAGQVWKTEDSGYVSIRLVGKLLVHFRRSEKPFLKGASIPSSAVLEIETLKVLESFLKRTHARLEQQMSG